MESHKILIVEDELISALGLQNQIRRLGYQVGAMAKSGEEAVRLAQELSPDLILMDVSLAGAINGLEASRRINEIKRTPIVYITAYPDVFLRGPDRMQEPGLCIPKPFSEGELQNAIQIALAA